MRRKDHASSASIAILNSIAIILYYIHTVLPVVVVTADRTRVGPGGAATLNCTVTRGNPMTYTYSWIHEDVPLAGETSDTLGLSSFSTDDNGTYSCVVMNKAGTGMDSVTIVLGGKK